MKNENTGYPDIKIWIFGGGGLAALTAAIGIYVATAPDTSPCGKLETEIVSTWKKGETLKAESQKALDDMNTILKTAALGGGIDKKAFAEAQVRSERTTAQLNELTPKIAGFPDRWVETGCSAERFEKFQKSHPEIFGS